MVDYNAQMVDRLHERWLEDDREEPTGSCCMCRGEAELSIGDEDYCVDCAKEEFRKYYEEAYCDICGEECSDVHYEVGNEKFCEDCFLGVFRI